MFSIAELIIYSILAFLVLILLMVYMLLYAKSKLVSSGAVKIKINGENEIEVNAGSTLLSTLGNSKIFLPSACGGGGTCLQCKCKVLKGGGEALPTEVPNFTRKELADELISGLKSIDPHYNIIAFVNTDESSDFKILNNSVSILSVDNLQKFVSKNSISEIVIATQRTEEITVELYNKLLLLLENGFIIKEYTQVYENLTQRIPVQFVARDFYKYFPFSRSNQNQLYLLFVRFFEVIIALLGISLGLVLLPLILIGNAIGNKGKLFYTQIRIGKNGEEFRILKFRTMVKNAEAAGAVFATTNDSRITPFGKFLRKSRIDEFPQFINILLGEMAVIGPRPERPVFVNEIAEVMPFYQTRHVVKPGLTGWAQVNYSYGDSIDDSLIKLQYDLYYIKHRSIFLDINIMIKTISTILFYRGQ